MAAGQVHDGRLARRDDELPEDFGQFQRPFGKLGHTVDPRAQHNAGAAVQLARVAKLGQHGIQPVGFLSDILQKQNPAPGINLPWGAQRRGDQRQVAAAQNAAGCSRNQCGDGFAVRILKAAGQTAEESLLEIAHCIIIWFWLRGGHGAVVAFQTADLVQKDVQRRHIGIAPEPLGMTADGIRIQQGENPVAAVAAADTPDSVNGIIGKGIIDIRGPPGVRRGQIAVPVCVITGGVCDGLHTQTADEVQRGLKLCLRNGGGGRHQRDPGAGE